MTSSDIEYNSPEIYLVCNSENFFLSFFLSFLFSLKPRAHGIVPVRGIKATCFNLHRSPRSEAQRICMMMYRIDDMNA